MAKEQLSTEIVRRRVKDSGPDAGSPSFTVRVGHGLPDFLNSVNLKYVKLGYSYLISHRLYFLTLVAPVVIVVFGAEMKKLTWEDIRNKCDLMDIILVMGLFALTLYIYIDWTPRSIYLVDFACYRPPNELKTSKKDFIKLARESGKFDDKAIEFQQRILKYSGIGDESYMPRSIFCPGHQISIKDGREEAALVMFGAINDLFRATKIKPSDIRILVVNCGILNTTPSLSAMVINHYKLKMNVQSYNLGGMGCSAGIIAIDLAKDLLIAYPGSYALVVSTEIVSSAWYTGQEHDMLISNCFFRMGAAALLLSSGLIDRWRSKYELKQVVRIHKGTEDRSFKSIQLKEDKEGKNGLSVSKDVVELGGHALKANITTLGPLVLPISEQLQFFTTLLFKKKTTKPYIPDYKLAFEHICVLPTSKKMLDEIQNNLELTEEYIEASRKTLERFGNTSSSGIWYELAYLEAESKIKKGHRICQIACGSGFKCNSAVWIALKNVRKPKKSAWIEDSTSYGVH